MTTPPLLPESIAGLIEAHAGSRPRVAAIGGPGRRPLTFGELAGTVERVTGRLNTLGFGRDTRIAIVLPGGADLGIAILGVSAGAVAVPLDPRLTAAELGGRFAALAVQAVLLREGLDSPARVAARTAHLPVIELSGRLSDRAWSLSLREPAVRPPAGVGYSNPDDVALVLQTSGTTGAPSAVRLRHRQLCASARNVVTALALTPEDRCLNVMPLFHVHGLVGSLLAALTAGSRVTCAPGFSALRFQTWLEEVRPTWYTAVPTMHYAILRMVAAPAGRRAARLGLRLVRSASAPLVPRLMAELERVLGAPVIEAYGMTEAAHQITSNPLPPAPRKPGSVGLPVGVDVVVRDMAGRRVGPGRVGEIAIRGATVSRDTQDGGTRASRAWVRTGDAGFVDADGYLFLTGRLSETINRGGEKIAPQEVDAVLLEHPAVVDAISVPVPAVELGEEVGAMVVLRRGVRTTANEIRAFVAERLADFKVPRRLELVAAIPRLATGKAARRRLGEALGADSAARASVPGVPWAATPDAGPVGDLSERLLAFVERHVAERGGLSGLPLTDETSLIRSALFDSLALVGLVEWLERETGKTARLIEGRLLAECDTVREIARALEGPRAAPKATRRRSRRSAIPPRAFPAYRFLPYEPKWREGLLALQRHHWGTDADRNAALFEWKYEKNPYASEPLVFLALHGDEVVGMRGFCAGLWEIGRRPKVFRALAGGDLVVSPEHRGRGVLHGIMAGVHADLARQGFEFLFNFSAGRATYLASLATGWRPLAALGVLQCLSTSDPRKPGDDLFAPLDRAVAEPVSIDRAPRPDAMLAVLDRVRGDARLRQVCDERYLAWRYGNPMSRYRFLFWDEGRVQGYLVLQTSLHLGSGSGSRVNVLEWAATTARARDGLLRCVVERGAFPEVRVWAASAARSARRLLHDLGFQPLAGRGGVPRYPSVVLARLLGETVSGRDPWRLSGRSLRDPATWDLRMTYSDSV
jgi:acyl-CoA synthetase (AMP-forming)/AMP-acid ligase II/GNAT superfamily N-acetyltransferase